MKSEQLEDGFATMSDGLNDANQLVLTSSMFGQQSDITANVKVRLVSAHETNGNL